MYSHIVPSIFDKKIDELEDNIRDYEEDEYRVKYYQSKIDVLEDALEILNEE